MENAAKNPAILHIPGSQTPMRASPQFCTKQSLGFGPSRKRFNYFWPKSIKAFLTYVSRKKNAKKSCGGRQPPSRTFYKAWNNSVVKALQDQYQSNRLGRQYHVSAPTRWSRMASLWHNFQIWGNIYFMSLGSNKNTSINVRKISP